MPLPSAPLVLGVAALSVSALGAVNTSSDISQLNPFLVQGQIHRPSVASGQTLSASSNILAERDEALDSDQDRSDAQDEQAKKLADAADRQAAAREDALNRVNTSADKQADYIAANAWTLPLTSYRLTAGFGDSGLWSSTHTGLDFAAPSGSHIKAVARGRVTFVGYDGSYGNKVVVTLEDGTEIWYAHMTSFAVKVGEVVAAEELLGYVGSTGNSTGPHLHLEVRPGAGDPVNPYNALIEHGVRP